MPTSSSVAFEASSRVFDDPSIPPAIHGIDHEDPSLFHPRTTLPDLQQNVAAIGGKSTGEGSTNTEPPFGGSEGLRFDGIQTAYARSVWCGVGEDGEDSSGEATCTEGEDQSYYEPGCGEAKLREGDVGRNRMYHGGRGGEALHCFLCTTLGWTYSSLGFNDSERRLIPDELVINPAQAAWEMKAKNFKCLPRSNEI